jgi:hypothetical protein
MKNLRVAVVGCGFWSRFQVPAWLELSDVARFLFGEAKQLACQIQRIDPGIAGEDVATALLKMQIGMTVNCNLSCASRTEIIAM